MIPSVSTYNGYTSAMTSTASKFQPAIHLVPLDTTADYSYNEATMSSGPPTPKSMLRGDAPIFVSQKQLFSPRNQQQASSLRGDAPEFIPNNDHPSMLELVDVCPPLDLHFGVHNNAHPSPVHPVYYRPAFHWPQQYHQPFFGYENYRLGGFMQHGRNNFWGWDQGDNYNHISSFNDCNNGGANGSNMNIWRRSKRNKKNKKKRINCVTLD